MHAARGNKADKAVRVRATDKDAQHANMVPLVVVSICHACAEDLFVAVIRCAQTSTQTNSRPGIRRSPGADRK